MKISTAGLAFMGMLAGIFCIAAEAGQLIETPPANRQEARRLTIEDCLRLALQQNHAVLLSRPAIVQAEADVVGAFSATRPFLGNDTTYSRLDKALSFSLGPEPLTNLCRDPIWIFREYSSLISDRFGMPIAPKSGSNHVAGSDKCGNAI